MNFNWLAIIVAALIPTIIGFIWYNPKVFGNAWMKAADMTEEKMKGANMGVVFGVSLVLSLLLAFFMNILTVHQIHVYSTVASDSGISDPNSEVSKWLADFMAKYGSNFRTFKHGAFHGMLSGLFFALPILGTNALFERKGFKYIAVNAGYWIVTLAIMGAIVCGWV
jgi:hypothetical protein